MRQQNKAALSAVLTLLSVQAALANTRSTTGAQSATTQAMSLASTVPETSSVAATASPATEAATSSKPALTPIPVFDQLTSLTETLRRIGHATAQLEDQYNRHGADLDQLIMDPVMSAEPGMLPFAATNGRLLPPDPKWVSYSVNELNKLNAMLIEELLAIKKSSLPDDKMKVQLLVLDDAAEQFKSDCLRLQNLTQTNVNERKNVLKICQSLKDDISGINEIRKRMIRMLKPD